MNIIDNKRPTELSLKHTARRGTLNFVAYRGEMSAVEYKSEAQITLPCQVWLTARACAKVRNGVFLPVTFARIVECEIDPAVPPGTFRCNELLKMNITVRVGDLNIHCPSKHVFR